MRLEGGVGREKNDRALSGNELWPDRLRSGCDAGAGMTINRIAIQPNDSVLIARSLDH